MTDYKLVKVIRNDVEYYFPQPKASSWFVDLLVV